MIDRPIPPGTILSVSRTVNGVEGESLFRVESDGADGIYGVWIVDEMLGRWPKHGYCNFADVYEVFQEAEAPLPQQSTR